MDFTANWIWDKSSEYEKNYWLCFRKSVFIRDVQDAMLFISADSRYTLYINGGLVGRGPNRCWPFAIEYDTYDVAHLLKEKENVIAVEVNHYGTSTSQYIHQPGGLFLQLELAHTSGNKEVIGSDGSFRCRRSAAFSTHTSRVNVSQPYVEEYNAAKTDENWKQVDFDDRDWSCCTLAQQAEQKKACMVASDIEPLTAKKEYARAVIHKQAVRVRGKNSTVDFCDAFYTHDTSTADKLHTGYLATILNSPKDTECVFKLVSKMWPFREERFSLNGEITVMGVLQRESRVRLHKGDNLFMLDISGAYQRFYVDLHFGCEIEFQVPQYGEDCRFVAVGPFDSVEIGNIVCAEGFKIDTDDADYQGAIYSKDIEELLKYKKYIKPIASNRLDETNIKAFACEKDVVESFELMPGDQNMVIANRTYTEIIPSDYDTEFIVDFGAEVSGFVNIEVKAASGAVIDILGFEYMGDLPEIPDDLNNSMRYIADGSRSTYIFHRRAGFRYLLITVRSNPLPCRLYEVSVIQSSYPVAQLGKFNCSDDKLNRIWEISKDTLWLCMEDVFVDCPGFEQAFWIGDARNTGLYQNYVYGCTGILKRSLLMAGRSLERCRLPECHVPAGVSLVLPAWGLLWAIAGWDYYQYTGDLEFEAQLYPYIKKAMDAYISYVNKDGLFEIDAWNMLDWSDMDTPYHGIVTHQNGLLVQALYNSAEIAKLMGDGDTAERYIVNANDITNAINKHLWREDRQAYVDCARDGRKSNVISLLTNAVLFLSGCIPQERQGAVLRHFDVPPSDFVGMGSPFASFFKYEVLSSCKQFDKIIEDIRKQWGAMLDHDAVTCWETFAGFYKERLTRSYCHGWSSVPCYVFGRYVLGVIPAAAGFAQVKIAPHTASLQWAKGSVPTPHGTIHVAWKKVAGKLIIEYKAPVTVEVEVVYTDE